MNVRCFRKLARFFYRRPAWAIVLYIFILLPCFWSKPPKININTLDFVDSQSEKLKNYKHYLKGFSSDQEIIVLVSQKNGEVWNEHTLCVLRENVQDLIPILPRLSHFYSPFQVRDFKGSEKEIFFPRVVPQDCRHKNGWLDSLKMKPSHRTFFDDEFKYVILAFGFSPEEDPVYGRYNHEHVKESIGKIIEGMNSWHVEFSGNIIFQKAMKDGMDSMQILNLFFAIAILAIARLIFGSWKAGLLMLGCLFACYLPLQLSMWAFDVPMDPLTVGLFMVLTLAVVEDFVFISSYQVEWKRRGSRSIMKFAASSFFTTLTTVIGFGSLVFSDLASVRRFGLWTAYGVFLEWVVVFLFFTAILKKFPSLEYWAYPTKLTFIVKKFSLRLLPVSVAVALLFVMLLTPLSFKHINLNHSPFDILYDTHPFSVTTRKLKQIRGAEAEIEVVFSEYLSGIRKKELTNRIRTYENIADIEDITRYLPLSPKHEGLLDDMIRRESRLTQLGQKFISEDNEERVFVYLKSGDIKNVNATVKKLEDICQQECQIQGEMVVFAEHTKLLVKTLAESFVISLTLVAIIIGVLLCFRGLRPIWIYLLSALWAPCVLVIVIAVFQLPINMMTSVVGSIVVGLAGDNTIQFIMQNSNRKRKDRAEQLSLMAATVTVFMVGLSLLFLFSYFLTTRELGMYLALGFILSLLGDLYLLRSLKSYF
ncbi:MAG: hypothetical protein A4S09_00765 [Proteobacteria bacterium SG_bin7]|nr:MAG: hypothetical protein A4S09_00765 [Proteobacteria bacterium SG_bin7]